MSESSPKSARYLIAGVLALAILITIVFTLRYRKSLVYLSQSTAAFKEDGKKLDLEGCVDKVLVWNKSCEALKDLCDKSVPRMMKLCLTAQDRKLQCAGLKLGAGFVRTYHKACNDRGYRKGSVTKPCDQAYQTVGAHCEWLERYSSIAPKAP